MADIDITTLGAVIANALPAASVPYSKLSIGQTLVPYAATVTIDVTLGNAFVIGALTGDCLIAFAGLRPGATGTITVVQDTIGGRYVRFRSYAPYPPQRTSTYGAANINASAVTVFTYSVTPNSVILDRVSATGTQPYVCACSADFTKLFAGGNTGPIYTSYDAGSTWVSRDSYRGWKWIAASPDGTKLAACDGGARVFTSTDSGATWTVRTGSFGASTVSAAISSDGTKLVAVCNYGQVFTSADSGVTWTARAGAPFGYWSSCVSSADGTKLHTSQQGNVYSSLDSGVTWTARSGTIPINTAYSLWCSADGAKVVVPALGGQIYISADSGATWTARDSVRSWAQNCCAGSADGAKLYAAVNNSYIYTSSDGGVTWVAQTGGGARTWYNIACSSDGTRAIAVAYGTPNNLIYVSTDSGVTWTPRDLLFEM